MIKKIDIYIVKKFLKMFFFLFLFFYSVIFVIDFLDFSRKISENNIPIFSAILIVFTKVPSIIETVWQFIILLTSTFVLIKLASDNELTAIYSNSISLWRIIFIESLVAFFLGIIYLFIFNPLSILSTKVYKQLHSTYTDKNYEKNLGYYIENPNGIWFKQEYIVKNKKTGMFEKKGDIIIRSEVAFVESLIFRNSILYFLDNNKNFLKRINAENLKLEDGFWDATSIYTFKKSKIQFSISGKNLILL